MSLSALGLDDREEHAYRAVIAMPSATAAQLAEVIECEPTESKEVLERLERRGLVSRPGSSPDEYVAVAPNLALKAMAVLRQAELRLAETEIDALTRAFRGASAARTSIDVVEIVAGQAAVARRSLQLSDSAENTLRCLVKPPMAAEADDILRAELAAVARGVRYQVVIQQSLLEQGPLAQAAARASARGEELRVRASLPTKLIIADTRLALLPLAEQPGDQVVGAVLIHPSGLLDALIALFELCWTSAARLDFDDIDGGELQPVEAEVLTLLVAGLTDRGIAARLAISERSVQRHVRVLMDLADAQSRVQLGWVAAQRGWLTAT